MADMSRFVSLLTALAGLAACSSALTYDTIIRGGTIVDGSGAPGVVGEVAIQGDRIAAVGPLAGAGAKAVVDATGLVVAPGFINMLSHSERSLIADGRSLGELKQGVTLEVFGEGSMGPLNDQMKADEVERQSDVKSDVGWTTLGQE